MTKHTRRKITPEEQAALMAQYVTCINAPRKYKKELISGLLTSIPETLEERVDRTIKYYINSNSGVWETCKYLDFGIFVRNNKFFQINDLAIIGYNNGQGERGPVYGYSSKRKCYVNRYYVQYARWKYKFLNEEGQLIPYKSFSDKTKFKVIELPDVLRDRLLADPAVREFILERLRAINAATSGKHG